MYYVLYTKFIKITGSGRAGRDFEKFYANGRDGTQ
jgi:hypothetical protein